MPKAKENGKWEPHTDEELKEIAQALLDGRIFSDRHVQEPSQLPQHFMVLGLLEPEQSKELAEMGVDFIYEYVEQAAPRSINGLPCFFSMRMLTRDETVRMTKFYAKMKEEAEA